MASDLLAMASNLLAMAFYTIPASDGLLYLLAMASYSC